MRLIDSKSCKNYGSSKWWQASAWSPGALVHITCRILLRLAASSCRSIQHLAEDWCGDRTLGMQSVHVNTCCSTSTEKTDVLATPVRAGTTPAGRMEQRYWHLAQRMHGIGSCPDASALHHLLREHAIIVCK